MKTCVVTANYSCDPNKVWLYLTKPTLNHWRSDVSEYCLLYTSVYYYTTYDNNQITAVSMHHEDLDGVALVHYPIIQKQNIFCQN